MSQRVCFRYTRILSPSTQVGALRHGEHRFEWTQAEFQDWTSGVASRFGYSVRFLPVRSEHAEFGSPTQMGVFLDEPC